jgi:hypothetical protein
MTDDTFMLEIKELAKKSKGDSITLTVTNSILWLTTDRMKRDKDDETIHLAIEGKHITIVDG